MTLGTVAAKLMTMPSVRKASLRCEELTDMSYK